MARETPHHFINYDIKYTFNSENIILLLEPYKTYGVGVVKFTLNSSKTTSLSLTTKVSFTV